MDLHLSLNRKEVNVMKEYSKPELTVLGNAARLIQSSKPAGRLDSQDPEHELPQTQCTQD